MTNTMWGGRFAARPSEIMEEINASIDFDKRLFAAGHRRPRRPTCDMLKAQTGIISRDEMPTPLLKV